MKFLLIFISLANIIFLPITYKLGVLDFEAIITIEILVFIVGGFGALLVNMKDSLNNIND